MTDPIVKIPAGELRGRERNGALLFAGIPFAAPPTGERRFRPPQPHEGWSGTRDARRFGLAAPQSPGTGLTAAPLRWDEDCLTLNVCTPALDDARRPVMVWIHGGGFRTGKGGIPWYDGSSFATRGDVVTVTINYRLGALGFAHLAEIGGSDYAQSGVSGILDQIAALEWVRDHIAAFGGDPERVTVAGESAGGMSVGTLLGSPRAQGLFRAAIPQSGAAHHCFAASVAAEVAEVLAREAGAGSIAELVAVPPETLLEASERAQAEMAKRHSGGALASVAGMCFQPVIDGSVLPQAPIDAIAAGQSRDVDVLVGTNLHETTLFHIAASAPELERVERIAGNIFGERGDAALDTYRATRPGASPWDLFVAMTSDQSFRMPAVRLAEAQAAAGGNAWMYLFTWESRAFGGRLGSTHALEIPFAFHTLERAGVAPMLGDGPLPTALADEVHAVWTRFVRDGDPAGGSLDAWAPYDAERRATAELGGTLRCLEDPYGDERALWDGLI